MFTKSWKYHSPELMKDKSVLRSVGQAPIDFYLHFHAVQNEIPAGNLFKIYYKHLIRDPYSTVEKIYQHFGIAFSDKYHSAITEEIEKSKKYHPKHKYNLESFGYSEAEIKKLLAEIYAHYET